MPLLETSTRSVARLLSVFAGVAVIGLAASTHAALPEMRIVAATDVPLPDGTDATPQLASTSIDGDTAFLAEGPELTATFVQEFDKIPKVVIRLGDPSPGGAGTVTGLRSFAMTQARSLFVVETSAGDSLLLTFDGTNLSSAFREWYPDLSLGLFDLAGANAAGDALLRRESTSGDTLAFVRVPNGPDGTGNPIVIAETGGIVPGAASGGMFELPDVSLPPYMDDDGTVVFESAYSDINGSGFGVFFMLPGSSTLERFAAPFPGTLTGTETCCDLLGMDNTGVVAVVGRRDAEQFLFVGKPLSPSLAFTIPEEGLDIPNAPGYFVYELDIPAPSVGIGEGSFMWTSQIGVLDPVGFTRAVIAYEPGTGVRLIAKEGDMVGGTQLSGNFSKLVANGKAGFQFNSNTSVYRATRTNDDVAVERLAGPGDMFKDSKGTMVTATQVDSHLDSRAFEAGRVALTVYYTDPADQSSQWMVLVDGTAPPRPPEKSGRCQITDTRQDLALFGALGVLLLGISRRRARAELKS